MATHSNEQVMVSLARTGVVAALMVRCFSVMPVALSNFKPIDSPDRSKTVPPAVTLVLPSITRGLPAVP